MSQVNEIRRLKALDRQIVEIATWLSPAKLLNPTMPSRRRAWEAFRLAFRRGRVIDPFFEYLPLPREDMARTARAVRALDLGDTEVDAIFRGQIREIELQLEMLEARGTARFGEVTAELYGLPDAEIQALARGILCGTVELESAPDIDDDKGERLNAWAMADAMRDALGRMEIEGWKVVVLGEMSARMSVSARHKEVRIKSDSAFSLPDRDRLIVHELGTHVQRACNGFATGLLNLGLGLPGYMATEEGLASWMEQKHGLLRRSMTIIYAYRALGAHLAHHHSFADTFQGLLDVGASPEIAWDVTLRVKRGLTDTSRLGGNPKDFVYLQGHLLVTRFLKEGGSEEDLFMGKVAIDQIPMVKSILSRWDFKAND